MKPDYESRSLDDLIPEFREKAHLLILNCERRGVNMMPFYTMRGPAVQAKLWAKSRPQNTIYIAAAGMTNSGAVWLSGILKNAKAPKKPEAWATNAVPGNSWHQWGEAIDCAPLDDNGKLIWNAKHPHYAVYADEALKLGLTAGANFTSVDSVHVQLRKESAPSKIYTWPQIDAAMKAKFSA